jgi:DNA-binding MarR family transcriptional regulator
VSADPATEQRYFREGRGAAAGEADGPGGEVALGDDAQIDVARLRVALARLSRRLRKHQLAGLTPTQLAALATVERSGPMRLGDLAAVEGVAPSTLTRLVTALEESGYVRRYADPSDARASTLAITPHGHDALERIRTETTVSLAQSIRLLTPAQRSALATALPVLEQLAEVDPVHSAEAKSRLPRWPPPVRLEFRQAVGQLIKLPDGLVTLPDGLGEALFEIDDAPDGRERHALVGHRRDLLDHADLVARVAALAAGRPPGRDDAQVVDAAQKRLLDREHLGDLPDGVQRHVLIVER